MKKGLCATAISVILAAASIPALALPAHAETSHDYPVAFTGGLGLHLRDAPNLNDAPLTTLPEGTSFPAECEDYGTTATNIYGETTNVWMRAPGSVWVSTAYLNTGVNGRSGLELCSDLDAAKTSPPKPKTVADYHREGQDQVVVPRDNGMSQRVYYSKQGTRERSAALSAGQNAYGAAANALCAGTGVLVAVATDGASLVVMSAIGFGTGVGCGSLTGLITPASLNDATGAAKAAAAAGKCYEMRTHKTSGGDWVTDTFTVTEDPDYCA